MDTVIRHSHCRRSPDRRRPIGRLPLLLAAGLAILMLCPALAGAGGPPQHREADAWLNGVDVVGAWGWSAGSGGLIVHWSRDGGTREVWSLGVSDDIQAIDMATAKVGYVVTAGKGSSKAAVFKTVDGGRHWTRKLKAAVDVLAAVRFRTTSLGWVAGRGGTVLKTTNGGKTWAKQKTKTTETLYSLSFPSDKVGYAVGSGGAILKTVNAGKTWSKQAGGTTEALYGVDFVGITTGWAVGGDAAGVCLNTTDGGKTWSPQGSDLPPLAAVDFADATTGWVLGNEGAWPNINGKVIKVTAGGGTWTDQSATVDPSPPDYGLIALKVVDPQHAYAEGESEASLSTDDGELWHLAHIATP